MSKNKLITYIPITLLQVLIILLMVLFCYKLSQNVVGTSWQDEYLKKKDNTIDSLIIIEKHHIDEINSLKDELKHSEDVIDFLYYDNKTLSSTLAEMENNPCCH
jgi:uncharacterized membrane protein